MLVLLLACPAWGQQRLEGARLDLAVSEHLRALSRTLEASGSVLEQWSRGQLQTAETQGKLRVFLQSARQQRDRLAAVKATAAGKAYAAEALKAADLRLQSLEEAMALVAKTRPSSDMMKSYLQQSLEANRAGLGSWFRARQAYVTRLPAQARLREYYSWLATVLGYWTQEAELAALAQQLLGSKMSLPERQDEALRLVRRSLKLYTVANSAKAPSFLEESRARVVEEMLSLSKVCEAVQLWVDDASPDAVSRLRRTLKQLTERAAASEEALLEVLRGLVR